MPKILIVEDEPAAGRYLRSMIELKRPDFHVAGMAGNGLEALELVKLLDPDLVFTDVKMPGMDGIELVAALRKEYPSLPVVIVSGFQEFEYVRRALDTGVVDYLLKPVNPVRLQEVLDRLALHVSARAESKRAAALFRLMNGEPAGITTAVGPQEQFWLAVDRTGGLPSRFRIDQSALDPEVGPESRYILPGRDSRERIHLGQKERIGREHFATRVREDVPSACTSFRTVCVVPGAVAAEELHKAVREACLYLDSVIVPGQSQVHCDRKTQVLPEPWDKMLADRIEFALCESRVDLLEEAARDMVAKWRSCRMPLLAVESRLRGILQFILRKAPYASRAVAANLELFLEEGLSAAESFDELSDAAWSLILKASGADKADYRDSGIPFSFLAIIRYVENHYSEQITLGSLSETFHISSSYLSKLFRHHAGRSFGEFLSSIRIDAAKCLIRENPEMPMKDVAQRAGFTDPFYFSRVFKCATGIPPSDFSRLSGCDPVPEC